MRTPTMWLALSSSFMVGKSCSIVITIEWPYLIAFERGVDYRRVKLRSSVLFKFIANNLVGEWISVGPSC